MLDVKEIMKYLPHRYPFLLCDRISTIEADRIVGIKNVTMNEPFFQGHFPGNPIMPGVLIVEAMAQVAGLLAMHEHAPGTKGVFFLSIDKAKFRKPVVPGDTLVMEISVIHKRGPVWRVAGTAKVGDNLVSEAEMTAMLVDKEQ